MCLAKPWCTYVVYYNYAGMYTQYPCRQKLDTCLHGVQADVHTCMKNNDYT